MIDERQIACSVQIFVFDDCRKRHHEYETLCNVPVTRTEDVMVLDMALISQWKQKVFRQCWFLVMFSSCAYKS